MRKVWGSIDFHLSIPVAGSIVILLLTAAIGLFVGSRGISYREIMILGGVIVVGSAFILGDRGIRLGFICFILMFALGHRAIRFTTTVLPESGRFFPRRQDIVLHPLTLLILFLFVLLLIRIVVFERKSIGNWVPQIVWPFSLFWIWGLLVGLSNNLPTDIMILYHFINFIIIFPIFIITAYALEKPTYWKLSVTVFWGVATYIAVLGVAEFSIPGFASLIPGFAVGELVSLDELGFHRAAFAFWGHPSAIFTSLVALPFGLVLFQWHKSVIARTALIFSSIIILYGLYIAGWRTTWAASLIVFIFLAVIKRSWKTIVIAVIGIAVIYVLMPPEGRARFETFTSAIEGDFQQYDTSSVKRFSRVETAIQQALENPLGLGWTASGWVHSDFIQLAADTGLISAAIFIIWYLNTFFRLAWSYWRSPDDLRLGLLGSFFLIGTLFLTQPMYVQTQTIAPLWVVWAMADISLRQKGALIRASDEA